MPVDLEVSLAELLANLRVHAKFMSKRGPRLPCWNEKKKKPSVSKASEFSKEAGEIWILHAISCLHIGN